MSINTNDMYLLESMPEIMAYKNRFDTLNGLLNKTTLTGKISSLEIAENLFMFMDDTQHKFSVLQDKLINTLVLENYRKVYSDNYSNAQAIIDIIARSLQERTKDVQYLRKDANVIAFLKNENTIDVLNARFENFFARYSIYANIFLFDTNGKLLYKADGNYQEKQYNDKFIQDSLRIENGFVQSISDLFLDKSGEKTFVFSAPVTSNEGSKIGVIALQYDFSDEISRIFKKFSHKVSGSATLLSDENGKIVASSNHGDFPVGGKIAIKKHGDFTIATNNKKDFIFAEAQSAGYKSYKLAGWKISILTPLRNAYMGGDMSKAITSDPKPNQEDSFLGESSLMTKELQEVVLEAENINEDLGDVVINGEIIASKSRSYSLNPILNNIRNISEEINNVCLKSINGLLKTIMDSTLDNVKFNSAAAASLFDRGLYERTNGCRWLAMNLAIKEILKNEDIQNSDRKKISDIISAYNELYGQFHNIFVFDKNGYIVAVSNRDEEKVVGEQLDAQAISKVKNNTDINKYFVSDFEQTRYFGNKHTYILYASVISNDQHKRNLGGIGFVLNASTFKEVIECSLPSEDNRGIYNNMFGVIATKSGTVIASTNENYKPGMQIEIKEEFAKLQKGGNESIMTVMDEKKYIVGCYCMEGYREFRKGDGFNTEHLSMMFVEV